MLPTQLRTNRVAHAFVVPALRKLREGRGTPCIGHASKIKIPATRRLAWPIACVFGKGEVVMLPTQLRTNRVAHAFVVRALRKLREGRGTPCIGHASKIKISGTRRVALLRRTAEGGCPHVILCDSNLFLAQGVHGLDAGCAAGWDETCQRGER